jgi:hypothetical protein
MVFGATEEVAKAICMDTNLELADGVYKELNALGIVAKISCKEHIRGIKIRFHSEEDYNLYRLSSEQYQNSNWIDCVIVPPLD